MITKEQFEQEYARRSGVSVEWLHRHGQMAVPCDCGEGNCQGWAMTTMPERMEALEEKVRDLEARMDEAGRIVTNALAEY